MSVLFSKQLQLGQARVLAGAQRVGEVALDLADEAQAPEDERSVELHHTTLAPALILASAVSPESMPLLHFVATTVKQRHASATVVVISNNILKPASH